MLVRKLLLLITLSLSIATFSQTNFTYTPEKPKPGDLITITYEAAGALEGNLKPVEAVYSVMGSKHIINDLLLKRVGKKFTGTIQTDTSTNFIYLGFSIDGKYDNNNDKGYTIFLYENDQYKKGALLSAAVFYQHYAANVGVERDYEKALEYIDKERAIYADQKNKHLPQYANALAAAKKEEAPALILKEIEAFIKAGLKTEDDYLALEQAYRIARMPQQASLIIALKKEVFPEGKWKISDYLRSYTAESDFIKAKAMLAELRKNVKENPNWAFLSSSINYYEGIPYRLLQNK